MSYGFIIYDKEQSYHAMIGSGLSNRREAIPLETTADWYDLVEHILEEFKTLAAGDVEDRWPDVDVETLPRPIRRQIAGTLETVEGLEET